MISVITPVFNGEAYIEGCLQTVIDQHCENVEHLVMDGNSTDGTVGIVEKYAEDYPHIRMISEPDNGQSDAMNKGIAMAKGEILAILNVDDYYEPGTLNRVLEVFKTMPEPGLLVGNCKVWDARGNLKNINRPSKLDITDLLLGWKVNPHPVNPVAYFYHKTLHDVIGNYDINEHYALDLDFLLKAVVSAHVRYVDEILGNYRLLEGTKTVVDLQRGKAQGRARKLLEEHRRKLSLGKQLKVLSLRKYHKYRFALRGFYYRVRLKIKNLVKG